VFVAAESVMCWSPWFLGRDTNHWQPPADAFRPTRWDPAATTTTAPPFSSAAAANSGLTSHADGSDEEGSLERMNSLFEVQARDFLSPASSSLGTAASLNKQAGHGEKKKEEEESAVCPHAESADLGVSPGSGGGGGGAPRSSYSWLPFGAGPRGCLGTRLGLSEAVVAAAKLLYAFEFDFHRSGHRAEWGGAGLEKKQRRQRKGKEEIRGGEVLEDLIQGMLENLGGKGSGGGGELGFTYDLTLNLEGTCVADVRERLQHH